MSKVIIGIHGLANKPDEGTLKKWWKDSIAEGLKKNCHFKEDFEFIMVYWAGRLHKICQHDDARYSFDDLYNDERYHEAEKGALEEYHDRKRDRLAAWGLNLIGKGLEWVGKFGPLNYLVNRMKRKVARDLDFYHDKDRMIAIPDGGTGPAWQVLRNLLQDAIRKHSNDEIMLIAHSMGTIISYDTLRDMGRSDSPEDKDIRVPNFVTIGSPLGLARVKNEIKKERDYDDKDRLRTPTIVTTSWYNFADRRDVVAIDAELADDYKSNSSGVAVKDDLVHNDYVRPGEKKSPNPHKSYGYLRTPEVSRHIKAFLEN